MKKIILIITLFISSIAANAQLLQGDMIWCGFLSPKDTKGYIGEIKSVNGNTFTCQFVHSGNTYTFENYKVEEGINEATVKNNGGGAYEKGTKIYFSTYRPQDKETCTYMKVTFKKDSKSYLASFELKEDKYFLTFLPTNSKYVFSKDGFVIKSGGTYKKGDEVDRICADEIAM